MTWRILSTHATLRGVTARGHREGTSITTGTKLRTSPFVMAEGGQHRMTITIEFKVPNYGSSQQAQRILSLLFR